jgi:hypothetical protein
VGGEQSVHNCRFVGGQPAALGEVAVEFVMGAGGLLQGGCIQSPSRSFQQS